MIVTAFCGFSRISNILKISVIPLDFLWLQHILYDSKRFSLILTYSLSFIHPWFPQIFSESTYSLWLYSLNWDSQWLYVILKKFPDLHSLFYLYIFFEDFLWSSHILNESTYSLWLNFFSVIYIFLSDLNNFVILKFIICTMITRILDDYTFSLWS